MKKYSFTLIEMLIVVVIIGILAAALIPRIQSAQGRARDTKRIADIGQIITAMNIYYSDNGRYEDAVATSASNPSMMAGYETSLEPTRLGWLNGKYMTMVPVDPINKLSGNIYYDKVNKNFAYAWYYYPTAIWGGCPEYPDKIGTLGVVNFESLPAKKTPICGTTDGRNWEDYVPGFLFKGNLVVAKNQQ